MSTFHSKGPWHVHHVTAVVEETVAEGHQSILEQIPDWITEGLNQILSLTLQLNSCCQRNSKLHSRSHRKSSKNEILLSTFIPNVPLTHTHRVGLQPKPPSSDRSYHHNGRRGECAPFFFFFLNWAVFVWGGEGWGYVPPGARAAVKVAGWTNTQDQSVPGLNVSASSCQVDVKRKVFISQHFKPQTSVVPIFTQRTHEDLNLIFVIIVCVYRLQSFNIFPPSLPSK